MSEKGALGLSPSSKIISVHTSAKKKITKKSGTEHASAAHKCKFNTLNPALKPYTLTLQAGMFINSAATNTLIACFACIAL